jgi:hypothetical protein
LNPAAAKPNDKPPHPENKAIALGASFVFSYIALWYKLDNESRYAQGTLLRFFNDLLYSSASFIAFGKSFFTALDLVILFLRTSSKPLLILLINVSNALLTI